jgi:hypothetical protein
MGIDPETSRLVAQCLNYYVTRGPKVKYCHDVFSVTDATGIISVRIVFNVSGNVY